MSVRRVQIQRLIEEVTHTLYASGTKPTLGNIFDQISRHFSAYPAGNPLPIPSIGNYRSVSDVKQFNRALLHSAENVSVLYEVLIDNIEDILTMTSSLQSNLARLKSKRKRIETRIDDYLFSLYSTDGYFYSASDTFSDLEMTNVDLTSAYIDTDSGTVSIPTITSLSKQIPPREIGLSSTSASVNGATVTWRELSPFMGAIESGLSNTFWAVEVDLNKPATVNLEIRVIFARPTAVSRVDFTPYGVKPVRVMMHPLNQVGATVILGQAPYGNKIPFGTERMVFVDSLADLVGMRIMLAKDDYDYTAVQSGAMHYRYIFGAKDITFFDQVHDNDAVFVSQRMTLPNELSTDMVIDAVSLVVDQDVPMGTSIRFGVASDDGGGGDTLDAFDWRSITPITPNTELGGILRFDAANVDIKMIRSVPNTGDLQLTPLDTTIGDVRLRNPTPAFIPGVDVYRICEFQDEPLVNSLKLLEGVNTTRIAYTATMQSEAIRSVDFWATALLDPQTRTAYGRIDTGNDFFYGGDIGESDVSAYVETYLDSDVDHETFLAELSKADINALQWDVRVLLNGMETGYLPKGTHKALLPWAFRQGLNHIVLLVNIPANTYAGTINLMGDLRLYEYGLVRLDNWSYVDFFDLQYNTANMPMTYSIFEGQLVTRRRPTDNFRLSYALTTGRGPTGIRLRADLSRDANSPNVTPMLNSYRLRFAYGEEA
jgi:hypothetical protein